MLDRSVAPDFVLPASIDLVKAKSIELQNKSKLHILNAGTQEVVRIEIIFQAGGKYEEANGVSYFTSKMLSEGTRSRTSKEITEYLELYGAFYELHHGPDSFNITAYSLKKYIREVSEVLLDIIEEPVFPEEELVGLKNITQQSIKINLNKTSFLASNKFKELLFGSKNAYGKFLRIEDIEQIKREDLLNFYSKNIKNKCFDIVLSGNIDTVTIDLIQSKFGVIQSSTPLKVSAISSETYNSSTIQVVEKEDSLQSTIRVGSLTIKKDHKDYFNWVILNEILGGYFGSRLMKNIREEKGFTYGISSSIAHLRDQSYFVIGTDVKKENTSETLSEIEKEINILKSTLIPFEELDTVKNYMIGTFLSSINTAFSLADKFKSIYYFNLDYSFYNNYLSAIQNCTSQQLLETANNYLDYSKMLKVVSGGLD